MAQNYFYRNIFLSQFCATKYLVFISPMGVQRTAKGKAFEPHTLPSPRLDIIIMFSGLIRGN